MPQLSKQTLNACPIPPMHIIVRLLPGRPSSILLSNEWHNDMNPAFISAVMAPNLKINMATSPLPSRVTHGAEKRGMENGQQWLKTGKNGRQFKYAISKMHKKLENAPVWNKKLVERCIPHIPNRKGVMQKVCARRAPSAVPLPLKSLEATFPYTKL